MRYKLLALLLLGGSSLFAGGPRVSIGVGIGVGGYAYYPPPPPVGVAYVPAPPVLYAPPCPGPGYTWVAGYWYPVGPRYYWRAGYWSRPVVVGRGFYGGRAYYGRGYRSGWRR
jgi:hypothetical protein